MNDRSPRLVATVKHVLTLLVRTLRGTHRPDHTGLVRNLGKLREILRNLVVATRGDRLHGALHLFVTRLGVKRIEMTHAALHVQKNDMLCNLTWSNSLLRSSQCAGGKGSSQHWSDCDSEI